MNEEMIADLGRWEHGELRADELREFHPDGEADELLQMHARVSLAMSAADEQPDLRWEEIEARLDLDLDAEAERDRFVRARRRRVPLLKLVVAFVAGALVNPFQPADKAVDGMRAVARSTAHAVAEEVTDVFEPMVPPRTGGVVVLEPSGTQNLSAVMPEAPPSPSGSTEPDESLPEPVPQGRSEPHEPAAPVPKDSNDPEESDGSEAIAPSDPAPEPDDGPPSMPPGHQRRAERSPVHGGENDQPTPPGHERRPEAAPGPKGPPADHPGQGKGGENPNRGGGEAKGRR